MAKLSNKERREQIKKADRLVTVTDFAKALCYNSEEQRMLGKDEKKLLLNISINMNRNEAFKFHYMQELRRIYMENWNAIDTNSFNRITFTELNKQILKNMYNPKRKGIKIKPEIILENSPEARARAERRAEMEAYLNSLRIGNPKA